MVRIVITNALFFLVPITGTVLLFFLNNWIYGAVAIASLGVGGTLKIIFFIYDKINPQYTPPAERKSVRRSKPSKELVKKVFEPLFREATKEDMKLEDNIIRYIENSSNPADRIIAVKSLLNSAKYDELSRKNVNNALCKHIVKISKKESDNRLYIQDLVDLVIFKNAKFFKNYEKDLSGVVFKNIKFISQENEKSKLQPTIYNIVCNNAEFINCKFKNIILEESAFLNNCVFDKCDFDCPIIRCTFEDCEIKNTSFSGSENIFIATKFKNCDLTNTDIQPKKIRDYLEFNNSNISYCDIYGGMFPSLKHSRLMFVGSKTRIENTKIMLEDIKELKINGAKIKDTAIESDFMHFLRETPVVFNFTGSDFKNILFKECEPDIVNQKVEKKQRAEITYDEKYFERKVPYCGYDKNDYRKFERKLRVNQTPSSDSSENSSTSSRYL